MLCENLTYTCKDTARNLESQTNECGQITAEQASLVTRSNNKPHHTANLGSKIIARLITVSAVSVDTLAIVAALTSAAFDTYTVTELAIALAALLDLEDVVHVAAECLGCIVIFGTSDRGISQGGHSSDKSSSRDGKDTDDRSKLPVDINRLVIKPQS